MGRERLSAIVSEGGCLLYLISKQPRAMSMPWIIKKLFLGSEGGNHNIANECRPIYKTFNSSI